jgi:anti-sigma-K factor RskA
MNSDPYDSAAWRSFGMLDADESADFDEAMSQDPGLRRACLEMDRLAAAIAATTAEPLVPPADHLERLRRRLGMGHAVRKSPLWLAVTGWSVAAALAVFVVWTRPGPAQMAPPLGGQSSPVDIATTAATGADETEGDQETRRLIQEIQVLRQNLEDFHQRDRVMFQVLTGRSMPLVMTMLPPGETMTSAGVRTSLTAMLGDALAATNRHPAPVEIPAKEAPDDDSHVDVVDPVVLTEPPLPQGPPMAVPIYDAARDAGTLVVSNLQAAGSGMAYNLWVVPDVGARPVYLGSLPDSSAAGADSFDFSLGSTMVLPAGFLLTLDPSNAPADPSETNTVLSGPPTPTR